MTVRHRRFNPLARVIEILFLAGLATAMRQLTKGMFEWFFRG